MPQAAPARVDGFLVCARYCPKKWLCRKPVGDKLDFPLHTVICDDPNEAIEIVLKMGYAFSKGCWSLRAVRVGLVGEGK